jgi:hypothetical protein
MKRTGCKLVGCLVAAVVHCVSSTMPTFAQVGPGADDGEGTWQGTNLGSDSDGSNPLPGTGGPDDPWTPPHDPRSVPDDDGETTWQGILLKFLFGMLFDLFQ